MARRVTWTAANGTLWVTLQEQRPDAKWAVLEILHFVMPSVVTLVARERGWPASLESKLIAALGHAHRSYQAERRMASYV